MSHRGIIAYATQTTAGHVEKDAMAYQRRKRGGEHREASVPPPVRRGSGVASLRGVINRGRSLWIVAQGAGSLE